VVVELGLCLFTKKEEGVIRIYGGSADRWSKKFLYHGVQIDNEVKFEFIFPLTMKDKVYTFINWLMRNYYHRLAVNYGTIGLYQNERQKAECSLVDISGDPVIQDMKACLHLLMNRY
jgi:hypothetical protein